MLPVIICSHNRLRFIRQTLESLKKHSDGELQVIVADDSDKKEVIDYLNNLKDITLLHSDKKTSIGQAFMRGAEVAKPSEYIYFSTDDMFFLPHWNTILKKALELYDDILIVGGTNWHGGGEPRKVTDDYSIRLSGLLGSASMLMRREDWEKEGYFVNDNEDSWICYQWRTVFEDRNATFASTEPRIVLHCGLISHHPTNLLARNKKCAGWQGVVQDQKRYPEFNIYIGEDEENTSRVD